MELLNSKSNLKAQGTINLTGEYIVKAMWNKQPAETTFEFVGGAAPEPVDDTVAEDVQQQQQRQQRQQQQQQQQQRQQRQQRQQQ